MTETEYQGKLWWKVTGSKLAPGGGRVEQLAMRTERGRKLFTRNAMKSSPELFTVEALHRAGLTKQGTPMKRKTCGRCFQCRPSEPSPLLKSEVPVKSTVPEGYTFSE